MQGKLKTPRKSREPRTSRRRVKAGMRQAEAIRLRIQGLSLSEIARRLGYAGPSGAYAAIEVGLSAAVQEPADQLRQIELARLDIATAAVMPKIERGSLQAVDRLVRIMDRRSKLLGLDAGTEQTPQPQQGKGAVFVIPANGREAPDAFDHAEFTRLFHSVLATNGSGDPPPPP
ncbi:MAG TPA: hypothetical protein PK256_23490, partial [Verrucomicrobiota bacterium]|nr:hypothetical protein [Verrucomicrobiota bacterium]